MNPEDYSERTLDVDGWPVRLTTFRLGAKWHSKADNVSPGANLARIEADTKEQAESQALERARQLLGRTRRHDV
jgi:hypothetical protein